MKLEWERAHPALGTECPCLHVSFFLHTQAKYSLPYLSRVIWKRTAFLIQKRCSPTFVAFYFWNDTLRRKDSKTLVNTSGDLLRKNYYFFWIFSQEKILKGMWYLITYHLSHIYFSDFLFIIINIFFAETLKNDKEYENIRPLSALLSWKIKKKLLRQ